MKKVNEIKPLKSGLIRQNCYVRDICVEKDLKTQYPKKTFVSIEEIVDQTGLHCKDVVVPYDITPESVKSYAEGCDYRRDPAGAVARGHGGINLGDLTEFQKVSNMDAEAARSFYKDLQERLIQQIKQKEQNNDFVASEANRIEGEEKENEK